MKTTFKAKIPEEICLTISKYMRRDSLYKDLSVEDLVKSYTEATNIKVAGYAQFYFKSKKDLLGGYRSYANFQLRELRSGDFFIKSVATASLVSNAQSSTPQSVVYCLLEDITSKDPTTEEEARVTTLEVAKVEPSGSTEIEYVSAMRTVTLYEPTRKEALPFVSYLC